MKLSEFIKILQEAHAEHGDIDVELDDDCAEVESFYVLLNENDEAEALVLCDQDTADAARDAF